MITYISEVPGQTKIEVTLDSVEVLPELPNGYEWIDVSCLDDYFRGVRVYLRGVK